MVKNDDIKTIVTTIVSEIKGELKKEIIQEMQEAHSKEITTTFTAKVRAQFDNKIDIKSKEFESRTKEISDGMNMDLDALKERFHEQLKKFRALKDNMKRYKILTETAYTLAYQNQQYSQKNNNMSYGATVGESAANSNLIKVKIFDRLSCIYIYAVMF